jgi:hypothetical protein
VLETQRGREGHRGTARPMKREEPAGEPARLRAQSLSLALDSSTILADPTAHGEAPPNRGQSEASPGAVQRRTCGGAVTAAARCIPEVSGEPGAQRRYRSWDRCQQGARSKQVHPRNIRGIGCATQGPERMVEVPAKGTLRPGASPKDRGNRMLNGRTGAAMFTCTV